MIAGTPLSHAVVIIPNIAAADLVQSDISKAEQLTEKYTLDLKSAT